MNDHIKPETSHQTELKIHKNATKVTGKLGNGKPCELYDNTRSIEVDELQALLEQLINDQLFGIHALSSSDGIIHLDKPKLSHIQINSDLYRLYLYRYHAIIENF